MTDCLFIRSLSEIVKLININLKFIILNEKYQKVLIKRTDFLLNQLSMTCLFNFTDIGSIIIDSSLIVGTSLVGLTDKHLFYLKFYAQGCEISFILRNSTIKSSRVSVGGLATIEEIFYKKNTFNVFFDSSIFP